MKPQNDEPCVNCQFWSNKTGCKKERYNSASMVIFGHRGFCEPKRKKEEGA